MRLACLLTHVALMGAALAGLAWRRRLAASRLLPAYLAAGIAENAMFALWPERFYRWSWWFGLELACTAVALALALELGLLIFGRMPAGRRAAVWITAIVLFVALAAIATAPRPWSAAGPDRIYYEATMLVGQAILATGILFGAVLVLASRYLVPLDPLHREVAAGFALWALVQAWAQDLAVLDPFLGIGRQGFHRVIYTGVLLAWAIVAWRRDDAADAELTPGAARILRSWRAA